MRKFIISALICAFFAPAAIAQDSARVRPSKVTFNNLLILATFDRHDFYSDFDIKYTPWWISDLSFDDFDREVVIETIDYKNVFGEMVRDDSEKSVVLQYDSLNNEYRINNRLAGFVVNPDNQKRFSQYTARQMPLPEPVKRGNLMYVYTMPETSGPMITYYDDGSFYNQSNVELDDKGRLMTFGSGHYTYDAKNNIVKIDRGDKTTGWLYGEKTGENTWDIIKTIVSSSLIHRNGFDAKITILERNEKGLWTRLTIEYMKNLERNADPVKIELVRYFDPKY